MSILNRITEPSQLKSLDKEELTQLAEEIRQIIVETVAANGGHLAPNLGVVELTLALHRVLNAPQDKIVWDVGHQSYTHKLLTGRYQSFSTLRQWGGISGFPRMDESIYDSFGVGHSSTSISAALGMAVARDLAGEDHVVAAVIGDGALTGGLAFEALNNAGHLGVNLLVILNDNEMSISPNVGALSHYLTQLRLDPVLSRARTDLERAIKRIPGIGGSMLKMADLMTDMLKTVLVPGRLFQELGFTYFGPIDGHDIVGMQQVLREALRRDGPVLVHTITKKGKGWLPAEINPEKFHSTGPFSIEKALMEYKLAESNLVSIPSVSPAPIQAEEDQQERISSFSELLGAALVELGKIDETIVAITAAMPEGTGLARFGRIFPQRFFDVGIAEEHGATFAAGLVAGGRKPVFAVYSTFLQRAVDQIIHDVCLQELPAIFAIDRAGLVGEDGPTHHGVFDLSLLQAIPNLTILAPRDGRELVGMLSWAVNSSRPVALRYPREKLAQPLTLAEVKALVAEYFPSSRSGDLTQWRPQAICEGTEGVIFAAGTMCRVASQAAKLLQTHCGIGAQVVNLRTIKPLDTEAIFSFVDGKQWLATLEENAVVGGVGSRIIQELALAGKLPRYCLNLGIPDEFIPHGSRKRLLAQMGLTPEAVAEKILEKVGVRHLLVSSRWTGGSTGR